jgi:integrase
MKPRSLAETTRHLKEHAKPLHHAAAAAIGRSDVAELLSKIEHDSGPVAANRVRSSLSAMWGWAVMEGRQDANPVAATRKRAEATRERVLSDTELALIWNGTGGESDHDRIVRLLMLTGLRRDEIGWARWCELDGDILLIPGARTKNGLPHEAPLPTLAVSQIPPRPGASKDGTTRGGMFGKRAEEGFSGWSRSKARLDARLAGTLKEDFAKAHGRAPREEEARLAPWTLHDLRRTMATWLSEHGEEPHIVEALLNHVSGKAKAGVAGVYNRASYRAQKRAALARWADHIAAVTGQNTANITTLRHA